MGQLSPPGNLGKVKTLSAGGYHSCAIDEEGKIFCWGGDNYFGQLNPPSSISSQSGKAVFVTNNNCQTCVIMEDGKVFCWGNNDFGQLNVPDDLV